MGARYAGMLALGASLLACAEAGVVPQAPTEMALGEPLFTLPGPGQPEWGRALSVQVFEDHVFIVDRMENTVHRYSPAGDYLGGVGGGGAGPGRFRGVGRVVGARLDSVWVSDVVGGRVLLFVGGQAAGEVRFPVTPMNAVRVGGALGWLERARGPALARVDADSVALHALPPGPLSAALLATPAPLHLIRFAVSSPAGQDFCVADLVGGGVWRVSSAAAGFQVRELAVPEEILAAARNERAVHARNFGRGSSFVPLYKSVHCLDDGGVWLSLQGLDPLGVALGVAGAPPRALRAGPAPPQRLTDLLVRGDRAYLLTATQLTVHRVKP
jgi:hypothetical protein